MQLNLLVIGEIADIHIHFPLNHKSNGKKTE